VNRETRKRSYNACVIPEGSPTVQRNYYRHFPITV